MMHLRNSFLFLAVSLALVGAMTCFRARSAPAGAEVTTLAGEFVDLLAKEDFAGAAARYDEVMRGGLPEPKLRQAWHERRSRIGSTRSRICM